MTDNFGIYHWCREGSGYPPDATAAASLLTIIEPATAADRQRGVPRDLDRIPNEMTAFKEFTERRAISMSLASTLFAPKLDLRVDRWSGTFNLVVGDSFADRVLHWNARLLLPSWLDTDLHCLRVGLDQLRNPNFLVVLGDFLKRRNHVNGGTGGQPQLTVRSISLSQEQLDEAQRLVSSTRPYGLVTSERVSGLDDVVPSARSLETARGLSGAGRGFFPRPDWTRFVWSPPSARPPANVPDHLSDAPVRQMFTSGYWCTDFIFERNGPGPRLMQENQWMLPRRWRMAGSFKISLVESPPNTLLPLARRNRDGNLTTVVCVDYPLEKIDIPTPYQAMQYALAGDGRWAEAHAEHGEIIPPNKVMWMDPSNEARYLTGVLGMAGGLQRANHFLLHPFLLDFFARLGGTPNIPSDKIIPTVNRLQKRAHLEVPFDLRNERERSALADLLVKAANALKRPMDNIKYDDLKQDWKAHRERFWAKNPQQGTSDPEIDWDKREEESLDDCLIELRGRQMVFQGHQWTCPKCHHKNWVDLAAIAPELSCGVCKRVEQAPVDIRWQFRPNQFLIESLRDHSTLSVIWVLSVLCYRARQAFIFVEPTSFGFSESRRSDAEGDLLAVVDGEAVLCEVKSSWTQFRSVAKLVALAKRLRPDIALLAVMGKGVGPTAELEAARTQLAAEGIKFELITLDNHMPEDDPYLRCYGEE